MPATPRRRPCCASRSASQPGPHFRPTFQRAPGAAPPTASPHPQVPAGTSPSNPSQGSALRRPRREETLRAGGLRAGGLQGPGVCGPGVCGARGSAGRGSAGPGGLRGPGQDSPGGLPPCTFRQRQQRPKSDALLTAQHLRGKGPLLFKTEYSRKHVIKWLQTLHFRWWVSVT